MCIKDIVEETLTEFCKNFITDPYLCYTEHGQHALYFTKLYNELAENERCVSIELNDKEKINICRIQKEYPTKADLGKSKRQNWDISVIKSLVKMVEEKVPFNNPDVVTKKKPLFDYLKLEAVIEFGLNSAIEHLVDDFLRVSHSCANVEYAYIVHLYRLSDAGNQISGRDWSANARDIKKYINKEDLEKSKIIEILKTLSTGSKEKIKKELEELDNRIMQKIDNYSDKLDKITTTPVTFFLGYKNSGGKLDPSSALYKISGENSVKII
jgi:hypothetical protein